MREIVLIPTAKLGRGTLFTVNICSFYGQPLKGRINDKKIDRGNSSPALLGGLSRSPHILFIQAVPEHSERIVRIERIFAEYFIILVVEVFENLVRCGPWAGRPRRQDLVKLPYKSVTGNASEHAGRYRYRSVISRGWVAFPVILVLHLWAVACIPRPEDPDRSGRALGFVARYGNPNGDVSNRGNKILTKNRVFLNKLIPPFC